MDVFYLEEPLGCGSKWLHQVLNAVRPQWQRRVGNRSVNGYALTRQISLIQSTVKTVISDCSKTGDGDREEPAISYSEYRLTASKPRQVEWRASLLVRESTQLSTSAGYLDRLRRWVTAVDGVVQPSRQACITSRRCWRSQRETCLL